MEPLTTKEFYEAFWDQVAVFIVEDKNSAIELLEKIKTGNNSTLRKLKSKNVNFPNWEEGNQNEE